MLYTENLPFPLKNNPKQNPFNLDHDILVGLKSLVPKLHPTYPSILHCYTLSKPSSLSSSKSVFQISVMDDLIGTESGDCMRCDADEELMAKTQTVKSNYNRKARNRMTRQYPPSIPLLAQTGNLKGRMPWILKREYGSDGRLIIKAERARHHEYYLETRRENGRLIMMQVPVDFNTVHFDDEQWEGVEESEGEEGECGGFESEEELVKEDSNLWQKSNLENNETVPCGGYVSGLLNTHAGGLVWNLGPLWKGNGIGPQRFGTSVEREINVV